MPIILGGFIMKQFNFKVTALILSIVLLGSINYIYAGDLTKSIPLPGHGSLVLKFPDEWKMSVQQPGNDLPPTIRLVSSKESKFTFLITPLWNKNNNKPFEDEQIKKLIENDGKKMISSAIEKDLKIETFNGSSSKGYYFGLTDKAPKPNEFTYCYRVGVKVGTLLLSVTLLTNDKDSNDIKSAFEMLKNVEQAE